MRVASAAEGSPFLSPHQPLFIGPAGKEEDVVCVGERRGEKIEIVGKKKGRLIRLLLWENEQDACLLLLATMALPLPQVTTKGRTWEQMSLSGPNY